MVENRPVNGTATVGVLVVLPLSLKLVRTVQSVKDIGSQGTFPKRLGTFRRIGGGHILPVFGRRARCPIGRSPDGGAQATLERREHRWLTVPRKR